MKDQVAFTVDDHEGGFFDITFFDENTPDGPTRLRFFRPSLRLRGKLHDAMIAEDLDELYRLFRSSNL